MADTAQTPEPADAAASLPEETHVEDRIERATVRRAPRVSVFLVVGAALGLLTAMILTFAFNGTSVASPNTGLVYSPTTVFGFLTFIFIPVGLALGGTAAIIFDRRSRRHLREATVDRETVQTLSGD